MNKNTWHTSKLKNLPLKIIDGDRSSKYPKREELKGDGIPFLNTTNIIDNRISYDDLCFISQEKYDSLGKGKLIPLDIIMTTRGSIGKIGIFHNPRFQTGFINAQMLIFRTDKQNLDPRFLYYVFCSTNFQAKLSAFASGSAQPQIPIKDLQEIEIQVPDFDTQQKIVCILSAYDDLIENNTRRIQILEEMAQAIYREWFVHLRYPGHEGVRMVESAVGMIPEGWEVSKLGENCKIIMGQSPESKYYNDQGQGLPFHQGVTDFGERFPADRIYCTVENRLAENGDILCSVRAPVGRLNIATKRIVIGRGLCSIRSKANTQSLLYQQLKEIFKEEDSMGGGTIFKAVTKEEMFGIKIIVPHANLVVQFEELCKPIDHLIENLITKNKNLRQQRDLLLPRLLSGELDILLV